MKCSAQKENRFSAVQDGAGTGCGSAGPRSIGRGSSSATGQLMGDYGCA